MSAMSTTPSDDPPDTTAPLPAVPPAAAGDPLDGELISDEEYSRTRLRKALPTAVAGLPVRWRSAADHHTGLRVIAGAVNTSGRFGGAVGYGLVVTVRAWWNWVRVRDLYDAATAADKLADRYAEIHWHRSRRRWWTVTAVGGGTAVLVVVDRVFGTTVWWYAAAVASAVLAVAGRRKDRTSDRRGVFPAGRTLSWTVNGDDLVDAFRAAKIIGAKEALAFPTRPRRDGAGWAVTVDLPAGRKASAAIAAREALASALGVDEAQLVLERVRGTGGHAGRLACWVADTDPLAQPALRSPLQDLPDLSVWDGVPLGATARGRAVVVALCWTSWLIAGLPRYGKSNVLRLFLVAACLDPHTRIYAVDLKDGADFTPLEQVAHRLLIASAEGEETEQTLLRLLELLIELENEVLGRYRQFKAMPKSDLPEGKITRALVENSMPWLVAAVDECQLAFEELGSDTKAVRELRRVIVDKVSWLVRKGPAAGVTVLLATQKPDRDSIPTRLRDNISSRIALRLPTQQSNDMALGTGKASAGVDATKFTERHRGAAWLLADDLSGLDAAEGVIIRAAKIDLPAADAAARQGRLRRQALGLLTGDATGGAPPQPVDPDLLTTLTDRAEAVEEHPVDDAPDVLGLLAEVLGEDETGVVATADLAARIGWEAKQLGEALWRLGIPAPRPSRRRVPGAKYPVSVQDVDVLRAAITANLLGE